jgi:hypothetical protein
MPTILNKTRKALSVPLPGGKKLFLGPGKSGQITMKAVEHPPLVKLVEADEIEITGGVAKGTDGAGAAKKSMTPGQGPSSGGGVRHTGDR